jgi:hypothetical protein
MGCRDRQPSRFTISRLLEIGATAATTAQHGLEMLAFRSHPGCRSSP